ncbi:MAG: hypothetical protein SFU25_05880 [Candidatus Caenarcaniphilales bacterium]|nr:hypothetical protein [Candidatus Caenarcaniphilales bacterium]
MGISSSTEIKFYEFPGNFINEVITLLVSHGWKVSSYLALGQEPGDDMKSFTDLNSLLEELNKKDKRKETICLYINYGDSLIGGHLFIYRQKMVIDIGWFSDRQIIEEAPRFNTDFSWYTPKLLLPFYKSKLQITGIKHEDCD